MLSRADSQGQATHGFRGRGCDCFVERHLPTGNCSDWLLLPSFPYSLRQCCSNLLILIHIWLF